MVSNTAPHTPSTGPFVHGCIMAAMKAASVSNTQHKSPKHYKEEFGHSSTK